MVRPLILGSITRHSSRTDAGAHQMFLGQVRRDEVNGKFVRSIEYTAHVELALKTMALIREDVFARHALTSLYLYHSLGCVKAGEVCLFVFASSAHRREATEACFIVVERIKKELPIWGKEVFEDDSHQWKENMP